MRNLSSEKNSLGWIYKLFKIKTWENMPCHLNHNDSFALCISVSRKLFLFFMAKYNLPKSNLLSKKEFLEPQLGSPENLIQIEFPLKRKMIENKDLSFLTSSQWNFWNFFPSVANCILCFCLSSVLQFRWTPAVSDATQGWGYSGGKATLSLRNLWPLFCIS